MTANLLITSSLLDSFKFVKECPPTWKDKAKQSFISQIRREPFTSPQAERGIKFENVVYKTCTSATEVNKNIMIGSKHFQTIANECLGGAFQKVFKKEIEIFNNTVLLYCKLDVWFPDIIKDIKTTENFKRYKYAESWQPKLYTYVADVRKFQFLVAEFEKESPKNIINTHMDIVYYLIDKKAVELEIVEGIKELFKYLHDNNLYADYYNTFSNNEKFGKKLYTGGLPYKNVKNTSDPALIEIENVKCLNEGKDFITLFFTNQRTVHILRDKLEDWPDKDQTSFILIEKDAAYDLNLI